MTRFSVEVFFDGDCPLCSREIAFLKRRDKSQQIRFVDIQQPDYQVPDGSKDYGQLMAEIHGRLPDGTWIKGVEVFRRMYDAIGWSWLVTITRLPVVRSFLDWGYGVFAPRRLALTGRCLGSCQGNQKR